MQQRESGRTARRCALERRLLDQRTRTSSKHVAGVQRSRRVRRLDRGRHSKARARALLRGGQGPRCRARPHRVPRRHPGVRRRRPRRRHVRHPCRSARACSPRSSSPPSCCGLVPESRARRLVRMAEEAYGAQRPRGDHAPLPSRRDRALERREGRERLRRGAPLPRRTARLRRGVEARLRADQDASSGGGRHRRGRVAVQLSHARRRASSRAGSRALDVARRPARRVARLLPPRGRRG